MGEEWVCSVIILSTVLSIIVEPLSLLKFRLLIKPNYTYILMSVIFRARGQFLTIHLRNPRYHEINFGIADIFYFILG